MQLTLLSLVYFIGFSHALHIATALWRQTEAGQSGRLLSLVVLVLAYKLFEGGVTYSSLYQVIPHTLDWLPGAVLLIGPLFYGYIKVVSGEDALSAKQWLIHLTPILLLIIVNSPQLFVPAATKVDNITQFQAFDGPMLLPLRVILLLLVIKIHLAVYLTSAWLMLNKIEQGVLNIRADASPIVLKRIKQLCILFIALEGVWVVLFILQQVFAVYALDYVSKVWLLFISLIVLSMGYYGLRQPDILFSAAERALIAEPIDNIEEVNKSDIQNTNSIKTESATVTSTKKYQLSNIPQSTANEVAQLIKEQLGKQQLFLQDDLTLTSLAEALALKPHLLSQVINQTMKSSFYNLINQYRIEYAITLLDKNNLGWSIERIAYESGFGNRVTFNNAFKKLKGCSPSAYRKNLKLVS